MKDRVINESHLVHELTEGSILAFNALYHEYSGYLYRFALGYLKSTEEAEELVQEVFTVIWEKRASLKKELSFKAFLFTIAFNIIRKHFRTKGYLAEYFNSVAEGNFPSSGSNSTEPGTSGEVSYDTLYQYIIKLIDQLSQRRKEIIIKSRLEGRSIREIAEEMNISHKTVENQLTMALKFIRTKLNNESLALILWYSLFIS